ncbi:hypothetical protein WJX84_009702 [Apatococcus fuscideae]|uniref:PRA1 family protein n=1 Tax=Apatococcus fuscideae TaxID=2026836 RepID=A0AAW1TIM1_9CHLO
MDWGLVTLGEVVASLQEVQWNHLPPGPGDCFRSFSLPTSLRGLSPRLKCNLYYYRSTYALILCCALLIWLRRSPPGLAAALLGFLGSLCLNNTFCSTLNGKIVKLIRMASPQLARRMAGGSNNNSLGAPQRRGPSSLRIGGVPRGILVGALGGSAAVILRRSHQWLPCLSGMLLGLILILVHASFRTPNLKTRLASARDEFRAVWRGYQADPSAYGQHDYML